MMTVGLAFSAEPFRETAPLSVRLARTFRSEVKFALTVYPLLGLAGVTFVVLSAIVFPGAITSNSFPLPAAAQPTVPAPMLAPLLEPIDAEQPINDTIQMVDAAKELKRNSIEPIISAVAVATLGPAGIAATVQASSFKVAADVPLPQDDLLRNRVGSHMTGSTHTVGPVGAATGSVGGILGVEDRPRFRSYVRERNVRSYDYDGRVAIGAVLPDSGVTYHDVPGDYSLARGTRYTIVNDHPVIVNQKNRIIEVIE